MRAWHLIPLLSLGALIALALRAWLGEDDLQFDVDVELADTPLPGVIAPAAARLSGVVFDVAGQPVSETLVALLDQGRMRWTHAASDGSFTFDALSEGEYQVHLLARGHPPTLARASAPAADIHLVLAPRIGSPPQIEPGARGALRGRVEPSGAGTSFIGYRLALVPLAASTDLGSTVPRWQNIARDGSFQVRELAHAEYRAMVLPPWAGESFWPDLMAPLDESSVTTFVHPLPEGEELALTVQAGAISGRIFRLGRAPAQLASSEALQGAVVVATPEASGGPARSFGPATTIGDGTFRLEDLPAGAYRVRVIVGDRSLERSVTVFPQSTTDADFDAFE